MLVLSERILNIDNWKTFESSWQMQKFWVMGKNKITSSAVLERTDDYEKQVIRIEITPKVLHISFNLRLKSDGTFYHKS
jgi:hypothetical protein